MKQRLFSITLLALSTWVGFAGAQESPAPAGGRTEAAASVPAERATPRATMATFFRAFRQVREGASGDPILQAVETLDLAGIATSVRETKGRELAVLLKDVLDKTERINVEAIPDHREGPPHVVLSRPQGDVVIAHQPAGDWRFTSDTLERLPAMAEALESAEIVEGVEAAARSIAPAVWMRSRMPTSLKETTFLLENWQWLGLAILVLLGVVVDRLVTALVARFWSAFFRRRTPEHLDPELAHSTARPLGVIGMAMTWSLGLPWLGLPPRPLSILAVVITFLITAGIVWAAYRAVDLGAALFEARAGRTVSKFDDLLIPLVRKALKVFIAAFGLVFVAENLDVDITGLLAGIGIGGLALALAAQDAVKNLFGSILIVLDRPFEVGDLIKTQDVEGTVEELGFRSTRVRTLYNSLITLPNANLISAAVDNFGKRTMRRWKLMLSVTYDTPPEKIEAFCEGIRELIRRHPRTRKEGFEVHFNEFAAASLDILVYLFFDTREWSVELASKHRLGIDILRLAERLGVEFAFPTQTIHLLQSGGEVESSADSGEYAARLQAAEEAARREVEKLQLTERKA